MLSQTLQRLTPMVQTAAEGRLSCGSAEIHLSGAPSLPHSAALKRLRCYSNSRTLPLPSLVAMESFCRGGLVAGGAL